MHLGKPGVRSTEPRIIGRIICPRCNSRLHIIEAANGGLRVSVVSLGTLDPLTLERFLPPDTGPGIRCPACDLELDPLSPHRHPRADSSCRRP